MTEVSIPELTTEGKNLRKIRSFVRREGRLTKGQEQAMADCWPTMGIDFTAEKLNWAEIFGNDNPVVLEIGFGMGASFSEMANNAPEKNFIGIEVHSPGVGACLMAARDAGVTNLRVMCHDAVEVFEHMLPENSLETVQLFFPDPWHKKRHHKRRIVQTEFAQMLRHKLKVGGIFHMATDWQEYAIHMNEVMAAAPGYQNTATNSPYIDRPKERPLTKFEARGHRLGHGVWDLKYQRVV